MILYYPFAESLADHPRLAASQTLVAMIEERPNWTVIRQACGVDTRYEDGLKALWGHDDLIILEQDVVPTVGMLDTLAQGHYILCAQAYPLWRQQYQPAPHGPLDYVARCAHRYTSPPAGQTHRSIVPGEEWADYAGFGCLFIAQRFQQLHAPTWAPGTWDTLDTRFSKWIHALDLPFHIHWPMADHHHDCPCHRNT